MAVTMTLKEICTLIDGELFGDPAIVIRGICSIDEPHADCISFIKDGPALRASGQLQNFPVRAVIISTEAPISPSDSLPAMIRVKDPLCAVIKLITLFFPPAPASAQISDKADIHPTAKIGKNVTIGAFTSIGADTVIEDDVVIMPGAIIYNQVTIGKGAVVHSGAIIREGTVLGPASIIQNGAIIGADGFGYHAPKNEGLPPQLLKVPQVGIVKIDAHVEIGANSCIDRATLGTTSIGAHTKIDNLVQVGHNTKIGSYSIACGNVGIAGSCKIGNGVILGGGAGVADHATIVDGVRLGAWSAVIDDLLEKGDYAGFPAIRIMGWKKQLSALIKLPELMRRVAKLEKEK